MYYGTVTSVNTGIPIDYRACATNLAGLHICWNAILVLTAEKKQEGLKMKGIKKALCLLVLLFSVALALPVTANASTNGHTAQEALAWAKAQVGKSLDYDGVYGAQCVDLIKYYYDFLGCASYARGHGCDYATNALPSGWARYQGAQPQPGDILVYSGNASNPYGHVAIYEAD